jgi:diadenosine tetraphosphatase ApaH/serine/threonine PP2A family protein phosphatase
MLRALLSDVHGNLEALETVLAHLRGEGAEEVLSLGDLVGYGANPNECIDRLRPLLAGAVAGNHDVAALGGMRLADFSSQAATAARWTGGMLSPENQAFLDALPMTLHHAGALLVHASPSEPRAWHYVLSPADALEEFAAYPDALCFIGHSHYPGTFRLGAGETLPTYDRAPEIRMTPGARYLVNVPSVGQPRDGDPRAGYVLWDDGGGTLRHVRLEYDVQAARRRILEAGLPPFLGDRLQWGE